jgi:hypothetical protein
LQREDFWIWTSKGMSMEKDERIFTAVVWFLIPYVWNLKIGIKRIEILQQLERGDGVRRMLLFMHFAAWGIFAFPYWPSKELIFCLCTERVDREKDWREKESDSFSFWCGISGRLSIGLGQ